MTDKGTRQRRKALKSANKVRLARAETLRALRTGEIVFAEVDLDAKELQGVRVSDLVANIRIAKGVGKRPNKRRPSVTADRLTRAFGVTKRTELGDLNEARKAELAELVTRTVARQRVDQ